MVNNCKFYKIILYVTAVFHFGLVNAIKSKNERVLVKSVECTPSDNGTFYPHPDCTKYYECASGVLFTRDCGPGTYFNTEINECDFPYNVSECEGGTRPPEGSSPASSSTTTVVSSTTATPTSTSTIATPTMTSAQTTATNEKTNYTTTPLPKLCSTEGECKTEYHGSCSSYFICIDGVLHVSNCDKGLYFNPTTTECDLPENVNCSIKFTTIANPTEDIDILPACPSNPSIYLPHLMQSSQYYLCEYGVLQSLFSCSNNYKFDFVLQTCKLPVDSDS